MLIRKLLPIHPLFSSDGELLFVFFQQQLQGWIQGDTWSEVLHLFSLYSGHSHLKWLGGEAIHSVRGTEGVWRLSVPKRQLCKPSLANWLSSSQICKIYTTKKSISQDAHNTFLMVTLQQMRMQGYKCYGFQHTQHFNTRVPPHSIYSNTFKYETTREVQAGYFPICVNPCEPFTYFFRTIDYFELCTIYYDVMNNLWKHT